MRRSKLRPCYVAVAEALVYASDNLSALFFSERSAVDAPSAFDKTDWSGRLTTVVQDVIRCRREENEDKNEWDNKPHSATRLADIMSNDCNDCNVML